jgi:hypothetical protein
MTTPGDYDIELEYRGLSLHVWYGYSEDDPSVGYMGESFPVQAVFVVDDEGGEWEISPDGAMEAALERMIEEQVERDRRMDREP